MSSRYGEQDYDRENYGSGQNRYGDRSRSRDRSREGYRDRNTQRDDERYGRGRPNSEYAWSEGRGWQTGREDYGSGSWEGEGQAYGERNRRYEQDYRTEGYGGGSRGYMQESNYPRSSFGFGERYGERGESGYGSSGRYDERADYGRESQRYSDRESYDRESSRDYDRGDERHWWDKVASWFGGEDEEQRRRREQRGGQHRGRGPKGYRRSEERIREDVNDRLSDDHFLDASNIEVKVEESVVILTGTVNDRYDKRRAEDVAEAVSGVTNVENRLRVGTSGSLGTSSSMGTTSSTASDTTTTGKGRSQTA